tara:strand:+ start:67 stop:1101 length:1035 start_codon:yes stop_codon:yes gene_type:complete
MIAHALTVSLLAVVLHDHANHQVVRVKPPSGTAGKFRELWCAPSFQLDPTGPTCSRRDVEGVDGAFVLSDVLSRDEAARLVAMAERMGFDGEDGDAAGRTSAACSWCLHHELAEQLVRRMATLLPWGVAVHSPGTPAPRDEQLPHVAGKPPWVRQIGGVPEGIYTLDGINCRARLYRYESDGADRFLPHYDEVWPGSRLVFGADGEDGDDADAPTLDQDRWKYADGRTPEATCKWAWAPGDRVSHLTVLLYLNDDFEGGETVLYPGSHASETPEEGSPRVAFTPVAGSCLLFGQSFKFGREGVAVSADAVLHEGVPVRRSPAAGASSVKYVLRTDVCYAMPYRG